MAGPTDTTSQSVIGTKLRGEVSQRLSWYERVMESALNYFAWLNGGGLITTVAFAGFLIQFRRPATLALAPALLFAAGLVFIGLFHLGHAMTIRGWARGKFRVHRSDDDEYSFVDDQKVVHRLFSHLHLWPVVAAGLCGFAGLISGLIIVYGE